MSKDSRHQTYAEFAQRLADILGHQFSDSDLIITALTHRSLCDDNSERLEFLGDRVLSLYMTEILFHLFPNDSEGDLSKRLSYLVSRQALADIASEIGLAEFIFAQDSLRHQAKILSDIFESVIGALYLDGGERPTRDFIKQHFSTKAEAYTYVPKDAKSALQEWSMKESNKLPIYEVIDQTGAVHDPLFTVQVSVKNLGTATGTGRSRKIAEAEAAEKLCKVIRHE